jgi:hypothetical protein
MVDFIIYRSESLHELAYTVINGCVYYLCKRIPLVALKPYWYVDVQTRKQTLWNICVVIFLLFDSIVFFFDVIHCADSDNSVYANRRVRKW